MYSNEAKDNYYLTRAQYETLKENNQLIPGAKYCITDEAYLNYREMTEYVDEKTGELAEEIPTKTSDLENDSGFITKDAVVRYDAAQTLTDANKAQARSNINAAAPDGAYPTSGGVMQYATNFVSKLTPQNASNVYFRPTASNYSGSGFIADSISGPSATIEKAKGKLLMFNQLCEHGNFDVATGWTVAGGTLSVANNKATVTKGASGTCSLQRRPMSVMPNHKYYIGATCKPSASTRVRTAFIDETASYASVSSDYIQSFSAGVKGRLSGIITANSSADPSHITILYLYGFYNSGSGGDTEEIENVICIDLTQMYGSGKEPQTAGEFLAQFPLDYYAYTATPQDLPFKATGLFTKGFNQWDEVTESGGIDGSTGENTVNPSVFRSKNFTAIFPNTYYFYRTSNNKKIKICYYDAGKNFISSVLNTNGRHLSPTNAYYVRFQSYEDATYNHDICINISWSEIRDGEYEPYWDSTLSLPNYDNFPYGGPLGFGDVHDVRDFKNQKDIIKIKRVDLGTLTYTREQSSGGYYFFSVSVADFKGADYDYFNAMSSLHVYMATDRQQLPNKSCGFYNTSSYKTTFCFRDDSYSDAASFKTAMSGKYLYYETSAETVIDHPIHYNTTFRCDDFGTEMVLPQNTSSAMYTAPMDAELVYGLDYEANIRNLPVNYANNSFVSALSNAFRNVGINMAATNVNGSWSVTMSKI